MTLAATLLLAATTLTAQTPPRRAAVAPTVDPLAHAVVHDAEQQAARPSSPALPDTDPPVIEDVAAAASNPAAAPVISVMMSDAGTGVGNAYVFYRAAGSAMYSKEALKGGTKGLFIARLPDGLQKTGFDYYIEATDVAGNGPSRIGSSDSPIRVERATEATAQRLAQQRADVVVTPGPAIHPAWMMLALGVGVVAGAAAGGFAMDLVGVNKNIAHDNEILANPNVSLVHKKDVEANKAAFETAATQDTILCAILGVVGAAGLVTGGVLIAVQE